MTTTLRASPARRRLLVATVAGAALAVSACSSSSGAQPAPPPAKPSQLVVQAQVARWHLPVPLSRAVVLPDGRGLLVAGGLTATDTSTAHVTHIDTTGADRAAGTLAQPVHDAAGAVIQQRPTVFGGGSSTTIAAVQALTPGRRAAVAGRLPRPRSDLAAASVGDVTYLLGGYDGSTLDPAVLQTTDGRHFATAAQLPTPVRYPAVGVLGHDLYAFGGETTNGTPTNTIQRIDTRTGTATVVGHLPQPLSQATALV